jgi:hypothetical protein
MHLRRTLAALAVGGGLLLGGLAAPAGANTIVVVATLGRNAPTYTSGTASWIASAQGEYVDDNYVTKPDANALRGRAAVQEKRGIKRVRIYDVILQQKQSDGSWRTIKSNSNDATSSATTAYAKLYTGTVRTCWEDTFLRTYRVMNSHGIRRNDDRLINKVTYSKEFRGPRLASDPTCPYGFLDVSASISPWDQEWPVGASRTMTTRYGYYGPNDGTQPAPGVVARAIFDGGIAVTTPPTGWKLDGSTADPNDWVLAESPSSWALNRVVVATWTLTATQVGSWTIDASLTSTSSRVLPMQSLDLPATFEVTKYDAGALGLELQYEGADASAWPVGTRQVITANMRFDSGSSNARAERVELRVTTSDGLRPVPLAEGGTFAEALHTPEPNDWYFPINDNLVWEPGQEVTAGFLVEATGAGEQTVTARLVSTTEATSDVTSGEDTLHVTTIE